MPENRFVGDVARSYDHDSSEMFAPSLLEPTIDALVALAEGGPVLEFAVGTGRVAIPLANRGVDVSGVDLSEDMLDVLRAKVGGSVVSTFCGDMASTRVRGTFTLVYLVFNAITNLTTQDEQVECFENAARHLRPGGRFVVENGVPVLRLLPPTARAVPFEVTDDYVGLDVLVDRTHRQISRSRHFDRAADGTFREFSLPFRYVWPSELDLMARIAGMTLEHRWSNWDGEPFTGDSPSHVSVWQRPVE